MRDENSRIIASGTWQAAYRGNIFRNIVRSWGLQRQWKVSATVLATAIALNLKVLPIDQKHGILSGVDRNHYLTVGQQLNRAFVFSLMRLTKKWNFGFWIVHDGGAEHYWNSSHMQPHFACSCILICKRRRSANHAPMSANNFHWRST